MLHYPQKSVKNERDVVQIKISVRFASDKIDKL
jgi:hypothetical protein